jgi:hypothetical protein
MQTPNDRVDLAKETDQEQIAAQAGSHLRLMCPAAAMPRVIHYGLIYDVEHKGGTWQFDKHWYFKFDAHACTPWDLKAQKPQAGIFPPPPHPSKLHHKVSKGRLVVLG